MTLMERWVAFDEAAYLNKKHDPYFRRRTKEGNYANVLIVSCQYPDWWYAPFIGLEIFVELVIFKNSQEVYSARAVRLAGVMVHHGRDFDLKDIMLL